MMPDEKVSLQNEQGRMMRRLDSKKWIGGITVYTLIFGIGCMALFNTKIDALFIIVISLMWVVSIAIFYAFKTQAGDPLLGRGL